MTFLYRLTLHPPSYTFQLLQTSFPIRETRKENHMLPNISRPALAAALCLSIFCHHETAYAQTVKATEVQVTGSKTKAVTIKPTSPTEYAPVKWLDTQGNNIAMIVAHENHQDPDGKIYAHKHLSIYTADKDLSKRVSRIDIQYGVDDPAISFEKINILLKKGVKLLMPDTKDGKVYQIVVENGVVKAVATNYTTNLVSDTPLN